MRRVLLFLLLLLPTTAADIYAQTAGSSDGLDFFVSYIKPTLWRPSESVPIYALIGAYQDNTVTISYFDPNGAEVIGQPFTVKAHTVAQVQLDPSRIYAMI